MANANTQDAYSKWLDKVDRIIQSAIGLSKDDLADANYWDMFEDGLSANDAAHEVMSNQF